MCTKPLYAMVVFPSKVITEPDVMLPSTEAVEEVSEDITGVPEVVVDDVTEEVTDVLVVVWSPPQDPNMVASVDGIVAMVQAGKTVTLEFVASGTTAKAVVAGSTQVIYVTAVA